MKIYPLLFEAYHTISNIKTEIQNIVNRSLSKRWVTVPTSNDYAVKFKSQLTRNYSMSLSIEPNELRKTIYMTIQVAGPVGSIRNYESRVKVHTWDTNGLADGIARGYQDIRSRFR